MLYDKLKNYSECGVYPFHMPGHKRNLSDGFLPYKIDLTEIYGFDNLHCANGCIKAVEEKAARLYSVKRAYMLINGSTGGILAAIRAFTDFGDKVLVARNCHKSVYNAVELCGLDAEYILPVCDKRFNVFMSVTPEQVELSLKNSNARLVILTSPTYEGVVSDIKSIAEICKKYGARLFVDEAHGAHFPFSSVFPREAVSLGADAAVVSLHKTLPSLTQTALLLTNDKAVAEKFQRNLAIFETSSPSYILMSSVEKCLDFVSAKIEKFTEYISNIKAFRHKCGNLKHLKLLNKNKNTFDYDISKLVISTQNTEITGVELSRILREKYKIELEMAYSDYVIAMTSVCDTADGFDRLSDALLEIDDQIEISANKSDMNYFNSALPQRAMKSSEAVSRKAERISLNKAESRISAEDIWAYPPGIPLIVAGEIIDERLIKQINHLVNCGVDICSATGNIPNAVKVLEFD